MAFPRCLGGALCPYGDIRISDIFSDGSADKKRALWIYAAQLAVNFSWSIVFFKYEKLWAGGGGHNPAYRTCDADDIQPHGSMSRICCGSFLLAYLNIATTVIN